MKNTRLQVVFLAAISFTVFSSLSACGKNDSVSEHAPKESAQSVTEKPFVHPASLSDLNANEWAELERRCLGSSNPTCDAMKGTGIRAYRKMKESDGRLKKSASDYFNQPTP